MGMEGSVEQSQHTDFQDSRSGPWSALFAGLGGTAIIGGSVLAFGAKLGSSMGWIALSLGRIGIDSGVAIGCGVISVGVSVVFRQLHRMNAKLAAAEESVERTEFLSLAMRQLSETMNVIHNEICELKDRQTATLQAATESNVTESVGMQVDATFRLASSVDQLAANFDERTKEQTQTVLGSLEGLSKTLESNQAELNTLIEESAQELSNSWGASEVASFNDEPQLECAEEEFEEFDGDVELEGWEEPGDPEVDVSSYDWDAVQIPEEHRKTDLGMLDEISDMESIQPPLPSQGLAPTADDGLGLLDELSDDGLPRESEEETETPPSLIRGKSIPLEQTQEPSGLSQNDLDEAWDVFNETEQE
jgi:hypothetical protein